MGNVIPIKRPAFVCGRCKYLGWMGLVKWCRHPDHVSTIEPAGQCSDLVDIDTKALPGTPPHWPEPVNLRERADIEKPGIVAPVIEEIV